MNWNVIRGHTWTDSLYNFSLKYLRDPDVIKNSGMTPKQKNLFKNRIKYYMIQEERDGTESLVLEDNNIPPYMMNTIYRGTLPVIYKVVKQSEIEATLRSFIDNVENHAISTHSLYDKVIRANLLGISRDAVSKFLKQMYLIKKVITTPYKPIIQSFRPTFPFEYWQMDLIDLNKISKSNKGFAYILVIIDIFSKFIYLVPIQDKENITIRNVLQRIFLSGDIPSKLGSDNELAFRSDEVKKLLDHFGVIRILGKPHSPQTQGFVENKNKQIKRSISLYLSKYKTNVYYDMLDSISFAINNMKHSVTKLSPMEIHRGRQLGVSGFFNIPIDETEGDISNQEYKKVVSLQKQVENKRNEFVRRRIFENAERNEIRNQDKEVLHVGDYVHIATFVITNTQCPNIQPNQIKLRMKIDDILRDVKLKNPLRYRSRETGDFVVVKDLKQYPRTLFSAMALKNEKWTWKNWPKDTTPNTQNVFIVTEKTPDKRYKLAFIEPQKNDYKWSVFKLENLRDKKYSQLFSVTELMKINRDDITEAYKAPVRPDFGFIPHNPKPVKKKPIIIPSSPKQIPTTRSAKYVKKEHVTELFTKNTNEIWKSYKRRITEKLSLSDKQMINNLNELPNENRIQIEYMFSFNANSNAFHIKKEVGFILGFAKKKIEEKNRFMFSVFFPDEQNDNKVWDIPLIPNKYGMMSEEDGWKFVSVTPHESWTK